MNNRPTDRPDGRSLRDAALTYGAAGIPVFPCVPGGKTPLTENGFYAATTDPGQIAAWWVWRPNANIGARTGITHDVLDIDVHATGMGYPTVRALHQAGLTEGWAHAVSTPSGGLHLFFPTDPDRPQATWSRGKRHIDFRGTGGYVIVPPSEVLIDGVLRPYEVIATGKNPAPVEADTIRRLLTPQQPVSGTRPAPVVGDLGARARRLAQWLTLQPEGNRNAGLFWAACRLTELGLTEPEMQQVLTDPARATGLPDREITATIRSAYRAAAINPEAASEGRHSQPRARGL